jgi:Resolvase, N terminal domain
VLVVWRLDRLARSLRHLIDIADDLNRRGIALRSLTESRLVRYGILGCQQHGIGGVGRISKVMLCPWCPIRVAIVASP